jgi:hypothetical protein
VPGTAGGPLPNNAVNAPPPHSGYQTTPTTRMLPQPITSIPAMPEGELSGGKIAARTQTGGSVASAPDKRKARSTLREGGPALPPAQCFGRSGDGALTASLVGSQLVCGSGTLWACPLTIRVKPNNRTLAL